MENILTDMNVCVGLIWMGSEDKCTKIEQKPDGSFINNEDELKDWANCLNDAWSDTSTYYEVHPNYHFPGEWIANRVVIVYDGIEAHIEGRGNTPQEAITECDKFMKEVIEKYADKEADEE